MLETWPDPLQQYDVTTPAQVADKVASGEVTLIDVRGTSEWEEGHIPQAQHLMLGYLPDRVAEIPTDKPVVVHCRTSNRSAIGASILQAKGVPHVIKMQGGYNDWHAAGLPVANGN